MFESFGNGFLVVLGGCAAVVVVLLSLSAIAAAVGRLFNFGRGNK